MNAFDLCRTLFLTFWSIAFIFFLCECGERVTHQFETFNYELDKCNWYLYPMGMQRILIIVMTNSQQSMFIRGYGNLTCVRDAFKKVIILIRDRSSETISYLISISHSFRSKFPIDCSSGIFIFYDATSNRWIKRCSSFCYLTTILLRCLLAENETFDPFDKTYSVR